jgi:hypothetical protein
MLVCFAFWSNEPAKYFGKILMWVKLSNSGDTLKLLIPSLIRKAVSGWSKSPCKVISQKMSENEMGYRGSKSEFLHPLPIEISVKEQRVDGSCSIKSKSKLMLLRCTLTGGESCYPIKIPSKQLNNRSFSTLSHKPASLHLFLFLFQ